MPFRSKKQWKFAFATKQSWARRWAHHTKTKFKRLPTRVRRKTNKRGRRRRSR